MNYKLLFAGSSLLLIVGLSASCNSGAGNNTTVAKQDSTKNIQASPEMVKLLMHFKDTTIFPVIIDSTYMAKIDKHDSLGANEVKMLAKKWFTDSLILDSSVLQSFYLIDSIKAKHAFKKWAEGIGMAQYSNAYGLQKNKLADGTILLEWALVYSQEDADPTYSTTTIYFTLLNNNTIGKTFMLGESSLGADPPEDGYTIIASQLTSDGKLIMERKIYTEDLDSMKGILSHTHYEYAIAAGNIILKNKKNYPDKEIKIKGTN